MKLIDTISRHWLQLPNRHGHYFLRHRFTLQASASHAMLAVTAGTVYRLYVNETLVVIGPARATSDYFFVDELNLTDYLRLGANLMALEVVYHPNSVPEAIQYEFPPHVPGVGLCLDIDGEQRTLGEHWRLCCGRALLEAVPWSRGLKSERIDVSKYPTTWMSSSFDDASWTALGAEQVDRAPVELRPRPTPLPRIRERHPAKVTDVGYFEFPTDLTDKEVSAERLDWFGARHRGEHGKRLRPKGHDELDRVQFRMVCTAVTGGPYAHAPDALLDGCAGAMALRGSPHHAGYAVYDFGEEVSGMGYIEATIPTGVVVDVNLMEWLDSEHGGPSDMRQRVCGQMVSHGGFSLIGDGGPVRFASLLHHSFRYICVTARGLDKQQIVTVRQLGVAELSALRRSDLRADVVCSDPLLNRIVEATKRTLEVNAHDYWADGTCERLITAGDCLQSSEVGRLFYGSTARLISEAIFDLFIDQGMGGAPSWPHMPRGRCCGVTRNDGAGEDMLWMLAPCMLVLDMLAWARERHVRLPPRYQQLALGIARDVQANLGSEGLLEMRGRTSNWSDWSKMAVGRHAGSDNGVNVSVNAYYYRLMRELAEGDPDEPLYRELAQQLQHGVRELARKWIESTGPRVGRFVPDMFIRKGGELEPFETPEANVFGGSSQVVSETTQYWLLWSGVLEPKHERALWDVLRDWRSFEIPFRDNTRMINPARASSVMGLCPRYRYMQALRDPALYRDVRDAFGPNVLADNTLWESLEQDSRSTTHAAPPYVGKALYEHLTGISPGENATTFSVAPVIDDSLEWARGYLQIDAGIVGVSWRRGSSDFVLRVGLPIGIRARIQLPEQVTAILLGQGHEVPNRGIIETDRSVELWASPESGLKMRPIDECAEAGATL